LLFDYNILNSKNYRIPLIGIGNLSMGGTGKTPLVEYVIRNFNNDYNLALLSRGYNRDLSGYIKANNKSTPNSIGDEPFQIFNKFNNIHIAVDEDRNRGVENLLKENNNLNSIILDDCFQHRYVNCKLNILLSTYSEPFFNDYLLPLGNLRESRSGYQRADVIIITKCPKKLSILEINKFASSVKLKNYQSLFFTTIQYNTTLLGSSSIKIDKLQNLKVLIVTGIADFTELLNFLNKQDINYDHIYFPDHHNYTTKDIKMIEKSYRDYVVLTTEKDYQKIKNLKLKNQLYYLEIETKFLNNGEDSFNKIIKKTLTN
jgi:tetraacyldisaccharide 4'-kinase